MRKSDLKTGMKVTLRNDSELIVLLGFESESEYCKGNVLVGFKEGTWSKVDCYNNNLTSSSYKEYDIMKIEIPSHAFDLFINSDGKNSKFTLLWKRETIQEMTLAEIATALGHPFKIIGGTTN